MSWCRSLVRPHKGLIVPDFWDFYDPRDFLKTAHGQGFTVIALNLGDLKSMYSASLRRIALNEWLEQIRIIEADARLFTDPDVAEMLWFLGVEKYKGLVVLTRVRGKHVRPGSFFRQAGKDLDILQHTLL